VLVSELGGVGWEENKPCTHVEAVVVEKEEGVG